MTATSAALIQNVLVFSFVFLLQIFLFKLTKHKKGGFDTTKYNWTLWKEVTTRSLESWRYSYILFFYISETIYLEP